MDIPVLDNNSLKMTQGRKSKGKKTRTEESQAPATQNGPQAREVEMPQHTTQASSQPTKRRRKKGPKMANIEFLDQVLDAFCEFMEENPVLWSNDKKYALQKKQKQDEAWQRLVLHLKEKFPDSDPDNFICKSKLILNLFLNIFKFQYVLEIVLIMSVCVYLSSDWQHEIIVKCT